MYVTLISWALLFILSIPHIIALRNTLMGLLTIIAVYRVIRSRRACNCISPMFGRSFFALSLFMGFSLMHSILISHWPTWSLHEFSGQYLTAWILFFVAYQVFMTNDTRKPRLMVLLFSAGVLLALIEFFHQAFVFAQSGHWPINTTFVTLSHLEYSYIMNICLASAVVIMVQLANTHRVQSWAGVATMVGIGVIIITNFLCSARNGILGMIFLSLAGIFMLSRARVHQKFSMKTLFVVSLAAGILIAISVVALKHDNRDQYLLESVRQGWNYNNNTSDAWLGCMDNLPTTKNGQLLDISAYLRTAWIHVGINLIAGNPYGYGFARNAFGKAAMEEGDHPCQGLAHAHSGFIDLGVGLGLIGIFLWLYFCATTIYVVSPMLFDPRRQQSLLVVFLVTGFLGRMLTESIMRDHELLILMFMLGGLLGELSSRVQSTSKTA